MPSKRRGGGASDTTEMTPRDDVMLLRFVELSSEETVVEKLRCMFNPKTVTDKLDSLTETITSSSSHCSSALCNSHVCTWLEYCRVWSIASSG